MKNIKNWKKANEIYSQLVDLNTNEALETLRFTIKADSTTKSIVEQLILASEKTNDFVEKDLIHFPIIESNAHSKIKSNEEFENYQLIEQIGQGGMSMVFKAIRLNAKNQKPVAIKIFTSDYSQKLLENFNDEQKILSQLYHPNIITMHYGGTTKDDVSYLVMELLENSHNIDDYVKNKKLNSKEIVNLLILAANAITYAHGQLVIHRDLKPSNIIINDSGELKVVDFGIATLNSNSKTHSENLSHALTPSFASPEQIKSKPISIKTDIFSLAVVATQLITGEALFNSKRLKKLAINDESHINNALKNSLLDTDLKNILNKALQVDPETRYNSMQNFADDLIAWINLEPVSATPKTLFYQLSKFAKRSKALFASLAALFLTLVIGLIVLSWQYKAIKIEALKSDQVKNFMLETFESTDPDISKGNSITANHLLNNAAYKLNHNNEIDKEIKFELFQTIGIAYGKLGEYELALKYLQKSLEIAPNNSKSLSHKIQFLYDASNYDELKKAITNLDTNHLSSVSDMARYNRIKSKLLARNAEFDKAIAMMMSFMNQPGLTINDRLLNQKLLAEIYFYQSNPNKSIEILKAAINITDNTNHTIVLELKKDLTEYLIEIGQYELALQEASELINIKKEILGENHPSIAETLKLLASAHMHMGNLIKAQNIVKQSHQLNQKLFGKNSIQSAYDLNTIAILNHQLGNLDLAIEQIYQAVEIFEAEKALDFSDTLEMKGNLAALLNINDQSNKARKILQEVLEIQRNKLGETHDSTLYTKKILAYTLSKLNHHEQAIELIDKTSELAKTHYDIKHPIVVSLIYNQAKIYARANLNQKANSTFLEIIDLNLLESTQALYSKTLRAIAKSYVDLNDIDNAIEYYQLAIANRFDLFGKSHIKTVEIQMDLLELFVKSQKKQQAISLRSQIQESMIALNLEDHPYIHKLQSLTNQL